MFQLAECSGTASIKKEGEVEEEWLDAFYDAVACGCTSSDWWLSYCGLVY